MCLTVHPLFVRIYLIGEVGNCFEFLQKVFLVLRFVFVCAFGRFFALSVSVLRQIARYLLMLITQHAQIYTVQI